MKEFKEIIVSKGESVYKTIERLKNQGELEDAWLLISREAESRMMSEDEMCLGSSRYVSRKFYMAIKLCETLEATESATLTIGDCDNPQKIFCLDVI